MRRSHIEGSDLAVDAQPVHVEHSTGILDGTVEGIGAAGGEKLALTLHLIPTNASKINGEPHVPGTAITYEVSGPKQ